jgi:hypothetical protein
MNKLTQYYFSSNVKTDNTVSVYAADGDYPFSLIFSGGIVEAYVDYKNAPDVCFRVIGSAVTNKNCVPITPTSYKKGGKVNDIAEQIAKKAGWGFVNDGVSKVLTGSVYLAQDAVTQISKLCLMAGITYNVTLGTLYIFPFEVKASSNDKNNIEVSRFTGMIGYPEYNAYGVKITSLFNKQIRFRTVIDLSSDYYPNEFDKDTSLVPEAARGLWVVYNLSHLLSSRIAGGPWHTNILAGRPAYFNKTIYNG